MERLYRMAEAYGRRFPDGVDPYQMATRLLEECGEVAREVNHFENSGLKRAKYGEPSRENFTNEIRQSLVGLIQLASYYGLEDLDKWIDGSIKIC